MRYEIGVLNLTPKLLTRKWKILRRRNVWKISLGHIKFECLFNIYSIYSFDRWLDVKFLLSGRYHGKSYKFESIYLTNSS